MIQEEISLSFDPEIESRKLKAIFANRVSRVLYLTVKSSHLVDQYFEDNCLSLAAWIEKEMPSAARLDHWMRDRGMLGTDDTFAELLLPYLLDEKQISFTIDLDEAWRGGA